MSLHGSPENVSMSRFVERKQKARLQCLASEIPKSVMPSGVIKSAKLPRRKSARIWQC